MENFQWPPVIFDFFCNEVGMDKKGLKDIHVLLA